MSQAVADEIARLKAMLEDVRCAECGSVLEFDKGDLGDRQEPPAPAMWYCAECGLEAPSPRQLLTELSALKAENERLEAACNVMRESLMQWLKLAERALTTMEEKGILDPESNQAFREWRASREKGGA